MSVELRPILQALAETPCAVAAWDVDAVKPAILAVFDVRAAPRLIVSVRVPQPDRRDITERLSALGHPTGYYGAESEVIWRNGPDAFEVWTPDGTGLRATKEALSLGDGTPLQRASVTAVVPFTDDDDVARGVMLRVGDAEHLIARHFKHLAAFRVDYEDGQGWRRIGWVAFTAHQLARWLGVPVMPRA
jgi:hypothetical protein